MPVPTAKNTDSTTGCNINDRTPAKAFIEDLPKTQNTKAKSKEKKGNQLKLSKPRSDGSRANTVFVQAIAGQYN